MFNKDQGEIKIGKIETIIGSSAEFKGDLICKGSLRIDGKVEGRVISEDGIIVGENGRVKGNITAKYILIGGKVEGDLDAEGRVEILPTGQLIGDIRSPRLIIAEGVVFEGSCEMLKEKPDAEIRIFKKQF